MSAQRKKYLQLAEQASEPRSKLFYKLMAEIAPPVSEMARRNVNQIGASVVYDTVLRASSALLLETAYNLGRGVIDLDRLVADFRTALEAGAESQQVLRAVECTPKLDA